MNAPLIQPSRMRINVEDLADRPANVPFKDLVLEKLGNVIETATVLGSDILIATYIKPRRTSGGIILTDKTVNEDRWQGKAGLILKLGETAFKYDGAYEYKGTVPDVGQYVAFHTSDSREIGINGVSCRILDSQFVRMIIADPDAIY